jgi:hypothetical protein
VTRALLVLMAAVVLSATIAQDVGAQAAFVYDRELGDIARKTLRQAVTDRAKPPLRSLSRVYVRCYRSRESFEHTFERRFGVPAGQVIAYYAGGGNVHLRGGTCVGVRAFLAGRHTVVTAAAYAVLLHESLHRQGMRDERLANCFANDAVRWGAEWLGFGKERALIARDLAFAFTRRFSPPAYHIGMPDCLALARRGDWIDHR